MKVICTTSNDYVRLIPGFLKRFNKFWPGKVVTVLGYDVEPELTENAEFVKLGIQGRFGKSWTDALIPYFKKMKDKYFCLFLDDYYLNRPVNVDGIAFLESVIEQGDAQKADLTDDRVKFPHKVVDHPVIESHPNARYRTSLQAAIWNREYFLKYLKPARTAWDFELQGEKEAMGDGARIIGTLGGVVSYENMMLKGEDAIHVRNS